MPRHADICGKRDLFVGASVLPMRFEFGNAPPSRCFQCYRRSQICRRLSSRIPFIYAFRVHGFSAIERVSLYTPLECLVRFIPSEQKSGQYSEQRVSFVGYQNQLPSPQHQAVSTRDWVSGQSSYIFTLISRRVIYQHVIHRLFQIPAHLCCNRSCPCAGQFTGQDKQHHSGSKQTTGSGWKRAAANFVKRMRRGHFTREPNSSENDSSPKVEGCYKSLPELPIMDGDAHCVGKPKKLSFNDCISLRVWLMKNS